MSGRLLPLTDERDLDPLLERLTDARVVLLGEASHGTHEYYAWRGAISRRLIAEHGFDFVAVEGDWPDCERVNRSVRSLPGAAVDPRDALDRFARWPTWMWANREVAAFTRWLRDHNTRTTGRVGFYGLDVYSLWESLRAVMVYLEREHPEHVEAARDAWRCFEPYRQDPQEYAWATRLVPSSCEDEVVTLLRSICAEALHDVAAEPGEQRLAAEQNAAVAAGAERYYRAMVRGGGESWNVRDTHMADTLDRLLEHYGNGAKAIVWEHNTHVGDARATDMAAAGMVNVGQLARERHGDSVRIVGFGGYQGAVIAADAWGAPMERMTVPPAKPGSVEDRLHGASPSGAVVAVDTGALGWGGEVLPHRAIGVVYHPEREAWGNWVPTVLAERYDAFCAFDDTDALSPLHLEATAAAGEQETYPSGR